MSVPLLNETGLFFLTPSWTPNDLPPVGGVLMTGTPGSGVGFIGTRLIATPATVTIGAILEGLSVRILVEILPHIVDARRDQTQAERRGSERGFLLLHARKDICMLTAAKGGATSDRVN